MLSLADYRPTPPAQKDYGIGIVGCGGIVRHAHLPAYRQFGYRVTGCCDIDPEAVRYNASRSPEIRVHSGSAADIPETDATFDVSLAFTLFSSVPDEDTSHAIARELFRITRPEWEALQAAR